MLKMSEISAQSVRIQTRHQRDDLHIDLLIRSFPQATKVPVWVEDRRYVITLLSHASMVARCRVMWCQAI